MTKHKFKKTMKKIFDMDITDLSKFAQKLFLAKEELDKVTFEALNEACVIRSGYLMDRLRENAYIELSELKMGEI